MHRFFVSPENILGSVVHIDTEQTHHIEKVLRLKTGDLIRIFDGVDHEYEIRLTNKEYGFFKGEIVQEINQQREAPLYLALVQGMAKGDKMDSIIQKAVEIGVGEIYPLASQYAVVKVDQERAGKKVERWQTIAREACKQCRRNRIPAVHAPHTFPEMMKLIQGAPAILLYENEDQTSLKTVLKEKREVILEAAKIFLVIGPEGGFSPEEVEAARTQGVLVAGLGPRILRTETAGLAAASIILYELADLG